MHRLFMLGMILLLPLLFLFVIIVTLFSIQDATYAHTYFSHSGVGYEHVLATRRWGSIAGTRLDSTCTYAIVSLKDSASLHPPVEWLGSDNEGRWSETPMPPPTNIHWMDPVSDCSDKWPLHVAAALQAASKEPESYYVEDNGVGEWVLIYSAPHKIAAYIRYGD